MLGARRAAELGEKKTRERGAQTASSWAGDSVVMMVVSSAACLAGPLGSTWDWSDYYSAGLLVALTDCTKVACLAVWMATMKAALWAKKTAVWTVAHWVCLLADLSAASTASRTAAMTESSMAVCSVVRLAVYLAVSSADHLDLSSVA